MYTLKNKDENKNVCISISGLNKIHNDNIVGEKKQIEAQLNEDWFLEELGSTNTKTKIKKEVKN